MASIARKNLLEDIPRFLVAQAGIMFAVCLVTVQTGLQSGFARSSSLLIDESKADIWVSSDNMVHLGLTLPIPFDQLSQARQVRGVERAEALIVRGAMWRDRADNLASATVIGLEPDGKLFSPQKVTSGSLRELKQPFTVFVDESSLDALNTKGVGDVGKLDTLDARIVGLTKGTKSLVLGSLIFTSLENANAYINPFLTKNDSSPAPTPKKLSSTDSISYVLVRAQPGEDLQLLKQKLEAALPETRAYTRAEMAKKTQNYWQARSGIGFVLGLGAVVGIIVGVVIVGQILYASVSDHIKEFGTLKAMGASDWFIYSVIMEQALWMAILGYVPGITLCFGLAAWTSATQGIMILITPGAAIAVLGITAAMCISSGIFAIQKVMRVDPAIVFKG